MPSCKVRGWVLFSWIAFTHLQFVKPVQAGILQAAAPFIAAASIGVIGRHENDDFAKNLKVDANAFVNVQGNASVCSGTFLSDFLLVTAAHCIAPLDPTGGVSVEGIRALRFLLESGMEERLEKILAAKAENRLEEAVREMGKSAPTAPPRQDGESEIAYSRRVSAPHVATDFAFVIFPAGTGTLLGIKNYPKFAAQVPEPASRGFLAAYGLGNMLFEGGKADGYEDEVLDGGVEVRGWGELELETAADGALWSKEDHILVETPSVTESGLAVAAPGDSGSMLLNKDGEGIGITVSMLQEQEKEASRIKFSLFNTLKVDVTRARLKGWLVGSGFASAHNAGFTEALKRAQAIPAPQVQAAFPKVYQRTGLYATDNEGAKVAKYYVIARYRETLMTNVTVREIKKGKAREGVAYQCKLLSPVCSNGDGHTLIAKGDTFLLIDQKADLQKPVAINYTRQQP